MASIRPRLSENHRPGSETQAGGGPAGRFGGAFGPVGKLELKPKDAPPTRKKPKNYRKGLRRASQKAEGIKAP